jgi:perosamine synthetase
MKMLDGFLVEYSASLIDAMRAIEKNASGIVFTVNQGVLVGSLTDGDVRRALISGASLNDTSANHHNEQVLSLPVDSSNSEIQAALSDDKKIIPLVNSEGVVLDFASRYKLHNFVVMQPYLGGNELKYVTDCITSNWISSQGKYVTQFEKEISKLCGGGDCIATSNGTTALHLGLEALGIGKGDEVIVPSFTFGASVNAIIHAGAVPVIVDIDPETWNVDLKAISKAISNKTKAIMAVHIYGNPCDMKAITEIARSFDLFVVEDCAEALGASIEGKPVGSFGDVAAFSFFANKIITCGEGGALILNDSRLTNRAAELRDHGMDKTKRYWHKYVGYNYRMTNMQAAVGLAQIEQFPMFVKKRQIIWDQYHKFLDGSDIFEFQSSHISHSPANWLFTLLINSDEYPSIEEIISRLKEFGIESRPVFYPMSEMPSFSECAIIHNDVNCKSVSRRGLSLPSSISLSEEEIKYISSSLLSIFKVSALKANHV